MSDTFCFGTLAVGSRYCHHAKILASDLQQYAPTITLVIFTDQVAAFAEYPNVMAFEHSLQSIAGYHDKRFVIAKAISLFDACVYLDADVRILGPIPTDLVWAPGITARTGCNILKFNKTDTKNRSALPTIEQTAEKLEINLAQTEWFHEFMFTVKKQAGAELDFLKLWETISYFFQFQGVYDGEGNVMGLAAAKAGLTVRFDSNDRFPFFKDNIERVRVEQGQSKLEEKEPYFAAHRQIEFPKRSMFEKVINRLKKKVVFTYRSMRLKAFAKNDATFQRFFVGTN